MHEHVAQNTLDHFDLLSLYLARGNELTFKTLTDIYRIKSALIRDRTPTAAAVQDNLKSQQEPHRSLRHAMDGQSLGLTDFFGIRVPPKKSVHIGTTPGPQDDSLDTIHLSQVALGPDAKSGRHVVWVEFNSTKSVIGSLTLGSIEQFQIDFPVNRELKISHSGTSDVYLTGYTTHQFLTVESDSSGLSESDEEADEEDLDALLQGPRLRQSGARLIAVSLVDGQNPPLSKPDQLI